VSVGQVISRPQWGARVPTKTLSGNINPINGVVGHHGGAARLWPYSPDRAFTLVRGWQSFHQDANGWADIAYNLIVDLYGRIFIGRGPGIRSAANGTDVANQSRYAICWLKGGGDPLTLEAKQGFVLARAFLRQQDPRTGVAVVGHRDVRTTECPGDEQHNWIKAGLPLPSPSQEEDVPASHHITGKLRTPSGKGEWLLQYDGGIITRGDARFYGSYPGLPPEHRRGTRGFYVIEPFDDGYMLTATDGAVYHFPKR
jgi:hypothetical protein